MRGIIKNFNPEVNFGSSIRLIHLMGVKNWKGEEVDRSDVGKEVEEVL